MAAQEHSTLSRLILGSTTDYVVHHSPVPVMVFPPINITNPIISTEATKATTN